MERLSEVGCKHVLLLRLYAAPRECTFALLRDDFFMDEDTFRERSSYVLPSTLSQKAGISMATLYILELRHFQ